MKLIDRLDDLKVEKIDNIPFIKICDFNYFYCAKSKNEYLYVCLNKSLISYNDLIYINKACNKMAKVYSDNLAFKKDMLFIKIKENTDIIDILNVISNTLISLNYKPRCNCIICGNETTNNRYNEYLLPLHDKCVEKFTLKNNEFINNKKTHIKKSIILSVLGSFIGIIPSLIISLILGGYSNVASFLLFLSPFCCVLLFYKSDIVRISKFDILCSIIPLLSIVLYHFIVVILSVKSLNISSINEYFSLLKNYILESILVTLFVYVVGVLSALFLSKKKTLVILKKKA